MQNKRGISLIVLVITIIVMIILAAAIIISLNNTGIIGNANKAKEESDLANIKTAADLEYSEYILDKSILPEGTTIGDYITDKLVESGTIKGKNDDYYIVVDNNVTSVIKVGSLADKYYKGEIKIGDYIAYNANNNEIVASEYSGDGCSNNGQAKDVVIKSSDELKWQVIGASGAKVLLVSEKSVAPYKPNETNNYKKGFLLHGAYSYLKGEEMLDNACSVFGKGYGAESARNIKIEDVEKIIGNKKANYIYEMKYSIYDPSISLGVPYGSEFKYDGKTKYMLSRLDITYTQEQEFHILKHPDINGQNYVKEKIVTLKQTGYNYVQEEEATGSLKLIFDSSIGNYYLSSMGLNLNDMGVEYCVFQISNSNKGTLYPGVLYMAGHVIYNFIFLSCEDSSQERDVGDLNSSNLRPVVELKENIMCEKVNNIWNLK